MAVNRNIAAFGAGTGRLSTDQKKKLLWGNKTSNPSEEVGVSEYMTFFFVFISFSLLTLMLQTSKRWDLFSDRERQEKFNKLMVIPSLPSSVSNILVHTNIFIYSISVRHIPHHSAMH
jgi:hypothetical protein